MKNSYRSDEVLFSVLLIDSEGVWINDDVLSVDVVNISVGEDGSDCMGGGGGGRCGRRLVRCVSCSTLSASVSMLDILMLWFCFLFL